MSRLVSIDDHDDDDDDKDEEEVKINNCSRIPVSFVFTRWTRVDLTTRDAARRGCVSKRPFRYHVVSSP